MKQKFPKIKRESKIYIITNKKTSNRKLMAEIIEKFDNPVSYKHIGDFKNSDLFSQMNSQLSQKIPKRISSTGGKKNNGKTKKTKEIIEKVESFTMVVSCLHVNAHKLQKAQIEEIVGSSDVVSVRKFLLEEFKEALTN